MGWLSEILNRIFHLPPEEITLKVGNDVSSSLIDRNHDGQLTVREVQRAAYQNSASLSFFNRLPQEGTGREAADFYSHLPAHLQERLYTNTPDSDRQQFFRRFRPFLAPSAYVCSVHQDPPPSYEEIYPGRHNAESPLFAMRLQAFRSYDAFARVNPAFLRLGSALYFNDTELNPGASDNHRVIYQMIPASLRDRADAESRKMYEEYCRLHHLNPETAVDWSYENFREGVTYLYATTEGQSSATAHSVVEVRGITQGEGADQFYFPANLVAIHELGHVQRTGPHDREHISSPVDSATEEVATTIGDILNQDTLYKNLMGFPLSQELTYPGSLPTSHEGERLNLGRIAQVFRPLVERYGGVEEALMSPEGRSFVTHYFSNRWTPELRERSREIPSMPSFPRGNNFPAPMAPTTPGGTDLRGS